MSNLFQRITKKEITLSYCTNVKNRLWQLAITLPENLKNLKSDEELILINYSSNDGLHKYIKSFPLAQEAIEDGRLIYANVMGRKFYCCSRAKNIAHLCASGKYVMNLDGDNYLEGMRDIFDSQNLDNSYLDMSVDRVDGSVGRICLSKELFLKVGGYDEGLEQQGHQDHDLRYRLQGIGIKEIKVPLFKDPIFNTMQEKSLYLKDKSFENADKINKIKSDKNLLERKFISNRTKRWGVAKCTVNFKTQYHFENFIDYVKYQRVVKAL